MSNQMVKVIYDCETKEETVIPLTAEEIEQIQVAAAEAAERQAAFEADIAAKQAAKESAIAKLSALGLTAEEAAAIVGV